MKGKLPRTALSRGPTGSLPELAARYLEENLDKIRLAAERLTEEELWWRPAPGTNSAGNLILHLCGNLSLWLLAGVGGRPYQRRRKEEFTAERTHGKAELLARLEEVVAACRGVLAGIDPDDLARPAAIQGYDTDLLGAVVHAVEHMSYHTGQVVWIAKELGAGGQPFELYPQHSDE